MKEFLLLFIPLFISGEGYSVIVSTPLHPYEAGFIVWKQGEEVMLEPY